MHTFQTAIVVGGGIVGLVCATALARRGVRVTVLEKKPHVTDDGGIGMGLQGNALKALDAIGIAGEVIAAGVSAESMRHFAPDGSPIFAMPAPRYGGVEFPGFVGFSRATFHRILVRAATEAGVELRVNRPVARLAHTARRVAVISENGERADADIVIGADGIRSAVRQSLFPESGPKPTGELVCRARVIGVDMRDAAMVRGGAVGTVGFTPIGNREGYLYIVDRAGNMPGRGTAERQARFRDRIAGYTGWVADFARHISPAPDDIDWRVLEVVSLSPPWHCGRVIVIGDAAHAGPPTLAQGAAMGIEDAVVLAECLDAAGEVDAAFATFMQRRYERVKTVMEASLTISHAQMEADGLPKIIAASKAADEALNKPF